MSSRLGASTIVASMAFLVMLGAGVVIPSVRPMFASLGATESQMHAFMSVNMIGAAIGAPLLGAWADRRNAHRPLIVALALTDAALLFATTLKVGVGWLLAMRVVQGATNVGVLSLTLGAISMAHGRRTRAAGAGGAAIMGAVALGPAVGGALLRLGPLAPLRAAACLALASGVLALVFGARLSSVGERAPRAVSAGAALNELTSDPRLFVPAALAFAERFTVGCFVVTFALYAHEVRHLSDAQTSLGYSAFLIPFAVATYPLARTQRLSRGSMLALGGAMYGASFLSFGLASGPLLGVALVVAGASSAMVYAPSLCLVASAGASGRRATSMAFFHGAGCVGMMLGPAVAGIASAVGRHAGLSAHARYSLVFTIGGLVQLAVVWALRGSILRLRNGDEAVRAPVAVMTTPSNFEDQSRSQP